MAAFVLIRGGGDLGSGIAWRLQRAGIRVLVAEIEQPLAVRRAVAFAEAIYAKQADIEGVHGVRATPQEADRVWKAGAIPVVVDPQLEQTLALRPLALVDARLTKRRASYRLDVLPPLIIGLGPGFEAGVNCHAAVETNRGHTLGRVYWQGKPLDDTGLPERVLQYRAERVLRAPDDGLLKVFGTIGQHFERGQTIAEVNGHPVTAPFTGVLRGIVHPGRAVTRGLKIGDLDPRDDPRYCFLISDKALALGGAVLEALLAREEIRRNLWT
jgi:xanthine dehydrogenase accessory factor